MNNQELLNPPIREKKTSTLTQRGIEQFNNGNLEEALLAFEEAFETNPKSIPNLLYHSLCCFSLLRNSNLSNPVNIALPENQKHIRDIISKLEIAINQLNQIRF